MRGTRDRPERLGYAVVALVVLSAWTLAACAPGGDSKSAPNASTDTSASAASPDTSGAGSEESGPVWIRAADLPPVEPMTPSVSADAPQRIVSLATGVGETLVALGVADRVVGRDETSDVPAIASVPVVTRAHNVSAEKVISLDPDLVIVDARTTPPEALDQIAASGATIVTIPEAWTLADMAPRTRAVAEAVGADPAGLLNALPTVPTASPAAGAPRVAFLYLRGTSAIYLLGGSGSGADALIAAAGGIDVGAEADYDPFVPLVAEAVAALDPDVLLVMTKGLESVNGVDGLVALPGVAQTTAGQQRRVIAVDDEVLLSFGPRTGALVDRLRQVLAEMVPTRGGGMAMSSSTAP